MRQSRFVDHSPRILAVRIPPISWHQGLLWFIILLYLENSFIFAGPPFLTDDPEPVPFRHYEFYLFSTLDQTSDGYDVLLPAMELNVGAVANLQLHFVSPLQLAVPTEGGNHYGLGDMELGAKYRFVQEKGWRPQIGIFPMLEIPTGSNQNGLGNGQIWTKLPIWLQKSWGPWTTYGGGGYIINHAPGMRDRLFFGWQIQREINQHWTLGAEWFNPGKETMAGKNSHLFNLGGFYNFKEGFSLLYSVGHNFVGESHFLAYCGFYWTWGSK
jgi:hypothetical protein